MAIPTKMHQTIAFGTDFWNDSCDLKELEHAVKEGAVGATSNPVIVGQAIEKDPKSWSSVIDQKRNANPEITEDELTWHVISELGKRGAEIFRPIYERTAGQKGKLCLQVNPKFYPSTALMVEHGIKLAALAPNIVIKVPATREGIPAMEALTAKGISINATVSFSVVQAIACAEAVERGWAQAEKNHVSTKTLTPVITIMVGRIDDYLTQEMQKENLCIDPGLQAWGSVAVFKKAYGIFQKRNYRSRLLAAAYRHHLHWSQFVGGDVVLSMPYKFWNQFNASDLPVASKMSEPVDPLIIEKLMKYFKGFHKVYDENGMTEEEFIKFPGTIFTFKQFITGLEQLTGVVRNMML